MSKQGRDLFESEHFDETGQEDGQMVQAKHIAAVGLGLDDLFGDHSGRRLGPG